MEQITTICYGKKDTWQSREEAQAFFLKAMAVDRLQLTGQIF